MQREINKLQLCYVLGGLLVSPLLPLMYVQGKKILQYFEKHPVIPPTGETSGCLGSGNQTLHLLVLGESTVEGIGVETFEESLSVELARLLAEGTSCRVQWKAVGKSGVTADYLLDNVLPALEDLHQYDAAVLLLGANDSFSLTSPYKWVRKLKSIFQQLKEAQPGVLIYLASLPPVGSFPALPEPTRWVLGQCNKLLSKASKHLADPSNKLFYSKALFENRKHLLCTDGIHPSAAGYALWAKAIAEEILPYLPAKESRHKSNLSRRAENK